MIYSDDAEDVFLRLDLVDDSVVADSAGTAACERALERFPAERVSRQSFEASGDAFAHLVFFDLFILPGGVRGELYPEHNSRSFLRTAYDLLERAAASPV